MEPPIVPSSPGELRSLPLELTQQPSEVTDLRRLADGGLPVAPVVVVPAAAEEEFYRLNNLPERLRRLFAAVDPADPDEDDLEDLAPEARALIMSHYLLDEFIDRFYQALAPLPTTVRLRRPAPADPPDRHPSGVVVARGRPSLLALKRLWQDDWSVEALMARFARQQSAALDARPVLISPPGRDAVEPSVVAEAEAMLGVRLRLLGDPVAGITAVERLTP